MKQKKNIILFDDKEKVISLIDYLIDLDMYVIVDWHILSDSNPLTYKEEAITFFDELSKKRAESDCIFGFFVYLCGRNEINRLKL